MIIEPEFIKESPQWDENVGIEVTDMVASGNYAPVNRQVTNIADRTLFLREQYDKIAHVLHTSIGLEKGEPGDVMAELAYMAQTKEILRDAINQRGLTVPASIPFRGLVDVMKSVDSVEPTKIINSPQFNPVTEMGGISWTDPALNFEAIQLADELPDGEGTKDSRSPITILPGVQFFVPETGLHQYRIQTVIHSPDAISRGVLLEKTFYSRVTDAAIKHIYVAEEAPTVLILVFTNGVKKPTGSLAGFTLYQSNTPGTLDGKQTLFPTSLQDLPQETYTELRFSSSLPFMADEQYAISYNDTNPVIFDRDGKKVDGWSFHQITNYSKYVQAQFTGGYIPQGQPKHFVATFSHKVRVDDYSQVKLYAVTFSGQLNISGFIYPDPFEYSDIIIFLLDRSSGGELSSDAIATSFRFYIEHDPTKPNDPLAYYQNQIIDELGVSIANTDAITEVNVTNYNFDIVSAAPAPVTRLCKVPREGDRIEVPMSKDCVIGNAMVGLGNPKGWTVFLRNHTVNAITSWQIVGGTSFNLALSEVIYQDDINIHVMYDGTNSLFQSRDGVSVNPFNVTMINESERNGVEVHTSPMNLSTLLYGADPTSPTFVEMVFREVHNAIADGNVNNLVIGDYVNISITQTFPFIIADDGTYGGIVNMTSNPDVAIKDGTNVIPKGKYMSWRVVAIDPYYNINGIVKHHVVFQSELLLLSSIFGNAHYMDVQSVTPVNTRGYAGSSLRAYLNNYMVPALTTLGIPFDKKNPEAPSPEWIMKPNRRISKGGDGADPGY